MIFRISMKTPDAADRALEDMDEDEKYEASKLLEKFLKYGEYVTLEFDTETQTCKVLES